MPRTKMRLLQRHQVAADDRYWNDEVVEPALMVLTDSGSLRDLVSGDARTGRQGLYQGTPVLTLPWLAKVTRAAGAGDRATEAEQQGQRYGSQRGSQRVRRRKLLCHCECWKLRSGLRCKVFHGDPGAKIVPWLMDGAPGGILLHPELNGLFPKVTEEEEFERLDPEGLWFFIEAAFKREQAMCSEEGITIAIKFQDNAHILATIDSQDAKLGLGVLPLLEEQCGLQSGSNEAFTQSCHRRFGKSPVKCYVEPKMAAREHFEILHSCCPVRYCTAHFREKNMDVMPSEVLQAPSKRT
ncbi:unnamed protein product [Effrenium voratum]|nr:unnamed protein product [Effrenium voratum]